MEREKSKLDDPRREQKETKRFEIVQLEERIAPSATVVHVNGPVDAHAVVTPSGNVNAHAHV